MNIGKYHRIKLLYAVIFALTGSLSAIQVHAQTTVFINEFHYDNAGTDTGEFIEIAGPAGTDLSNWNIVLYNGNGGVVDDTINIGTTLINQCNGFGTFAIQLSVNGLQNGPADGIALVDNNGLLIQFLSYEGTMVAAEGPAVGQTSTDIGVAESSTTPIGESLQLKGSGATAEDFSWNAPSLASPGSCNDGQTFTSGGVISDVPPTVTGTTPADNDASVAVNTTLQVTFSEAVTTGINSFSLICGGNSQALNPTTADNISFNLGNALLPDGVSCTLTVSANDVSDQDGNVDNMAADFTISFVTEAAPGNCNDPGTLISAVQGNADTSPLLGQVVNIEGIVVADYQDTNLGIFAVQEEDSDQDTNPATSEGLFVLSSTAVQIGDKVRVNGEVTEFFNLTELTNVNSVEVCSSGNSVTATTLSLPFPSAGFQERLEGMLVDLGSGLTVTENFTHGRFGELLLANGRLFQPTHVAMPGANADAVAAANLLNQIILDDASTRQNPDPLLNPDGSIFSAMNTVRGGSTITGTAVMHYGFSAYRLQPVDLTVTDSNPRDPTPNQVAGNLTVAAFNVLNYFTTLDDINCNIAAGCRGADSASEFTRQRDKIIAALSTIDADIVGLIEIENNTSASLHDLVDGINLIAGAGTYDFINTGIIGTDAIKVGFIYKPATVIPVGNFAILDSSVDPTFVDTKNRPGLAQTFQEIASSERFTVTVNHFKSKGSACTDVNDPDTGDGQGNCNLTRTAAATALANWLATDPTSSSDPDFLILGDLNSYKLEDPIVALQNAGFIDLVASRLGSDAYSYVFSGQYGYLDYALANISLNHQITGITEWHINSDEPVITDYNEEFKTTGQITDFYNADAYRSSDHDPVIIGLTLGPSGDGIFSDHFE